jgi:hypothetical protein
LRIGLVIEMENGQSIPDWGEDGQCVKKANRIRSSGNADKSLAIVPRVIFQVVPLEETVQGFNEAMKAGGRFILSVH